MEAAFRMSRLDNGASSTTSDRSLHRNDVPTDVRTYANGISLFRLIRGIYRQLLNRSLSSSLATSLVILTYTIPQACGKSSLAALGTCRLRLAQSSFLAFSRIPSERLVRSDWERRLSMCFDIGNMTVPVDKRSVVLGTCRLRLAQSLFLAFSRITSERLVQSEWERH